MTDNISYDDSPDFRYFNCRSISNLPIKSMSSPVVATGYIRNGSFISVLPYNDWMMKFDDCGSREDLIEMFMDFLVVKKEYPLIQVTFAREHCEKLLKSLT